MVEAAGRKGTVIASHQTYDPARRQTDLGRAATQYAIRTRQLGVDPDAAITAFRAALDELG